MESYYSVWFSNQDCVMRLYFVVPKNFMDLILWISFFRTDHYDNFHFMRVFLPVLTGGFSWSPRDSKSPQISRTMLNIQADFTVLWSGRFHFYLWSPFLPVFFPGFCGSIQGLWIQLVSQSPQYFQFYGKIFFFSFFFVVFFFSNGMIKCTTQQLFFKSRFSLIWTIV